MQIEPAKPQVVYVPLYNPTVVYGAWPHPAYPPAYYPPPPGSAFATAVVSNIGFGLGVAAVNSLWGGFDWGHHDVNINVNRYNNINVNQRLDVNRANVNWQHNAANRGNVPYNNAAVRGRYDQQRQTGLANRQWWRASRAFLPRPRANARHSRSRAAPGRQFPAMPATPAGWPSVRSRVRPAAVCRTRGRLAPSASARTRPRPATARAMPTVTAPCTMPATASAYASRRSAPRFRSERRHKRVPPGSTRAGRWKGEAAAGCTAAMAANISAMVGGKS